MANALAGRLTRWYRARRRDLPWRRRSSDAYAQLVAEAMLQQTQVATVVDYYERFMGRFPTVQALAAAEVDDVLPLWSGLGYYRRARNLHAAARRIVDEHGGVLPRTVADLMRLPGIGRYTAGAIASIAYDTRAAVLDGNVVRVLMRLHAIEDDPKSPRLRERLWDMAEAMLPARGCGTFNQALMELGATVCRPQRPSCGECPIRADCRARIEGSTDRIPPAARRGVRKQVTYVVAALRCRDRLYFTQRPTSGLWARLWELPTEEVAAGETTADARKRLRARLPAGCRLSTVPLGSSRRELTHRQVEFHVYAGRMPSHAETSGVGMAARWLLPDELHRVGLSGACRSILEMLDWAD